MTAPDLTRRLAARKLAAAARDRTDPRLRAGRLGPQRKTRRPRPLERNRLALLSSRRRAIPGGFAARAAPPCDRRHRGRPSRPLTLGRHGADAASVASILHS